MIQSSSRDDDGHITGQTAVHLDAGSQCDLLVAADLFGPGTALDVELSLIFL